MTFTTQTYRQIGGGETEKDRQRDRDRQTDRGQTDKETFILTFHLHRLTDR